MTDIVERLRADTESAEDEWALMDEAADEIERLRAALQHIVLTMGPKVPPCCEGCAFEWHEALTTARAALEKP